MIPFLPASDESCELLIESRPRLQLRVQGSEGITEVCDIESVECLQPLHRPGRREEMENGEKRGNTEESWIELDWGRWERRERRGREGEERRT